MLLFGKIYIHRITLALIAIIHVKSDAAWQGEGIVEVAHEDRTIQATCYFVVVMLLPKRIDMYSLFVGGLLHP